MSKRSGSFKNRPGGFKSYVTGNGEEKAFQDSIDEGATTCITEESDYKHAEAFHLMVYTCEKCGKNERIWNSRDGVTPFIVSCKEPECDGMMMHKYWAWDRFVKDYKLKSGDRYFIDETIDNFKKTLRDLIQKRGITDFDGLTIDEYLDIASTGIHPGDPAICVYTERDSDES